MFPETRQKSLEEIDILFDENIPAWKTRSGSRVDERAKAIERGGAGEGKRNSDSTLQQEENAEKPLNQRKDVVKNVGSVQLKGSYISGLCKR